ncbi:MAG: hypothetical protein WCQ95_06785 [Bacteroidota bacterium]
MKKIFLILVLFISYANLRAQDSTEAKYLVNNPKIPISGFGGILSETSILNKGLSESVGAGGALTITDYFFIGGYGLTLTSSHYIDDLVIHSIPDSMFFYGKKLRTNFSHAGIWTGAMFFPKKRFHFGVSTKLGWGNIHLEKTDVAYINNVNFLLDYTNNKVFVITPELELDVNITSWLKFNLGVGYRFVKFLHGDEFDRFKAFKFNTPQITIGLYFGGFPTKEKSETDTENTDTDTDQQ